MPLDTKAPEPKWIPYGDIDPGGTYIVPNGAWGCPDGSHVDSYPAGGAPPKPVCAYDEPKGSDHSAS